MPTRNVVLTDHQSELLDRLVASGRYQNASEAIRAGLNSLEIEEEKALRLRKTLMEGLAALEAGDFAEGDIDDVFASALAEATARVAARNE
ncbi:MAG: type II toxin-antitoxin system ParD family antitoxin [Pseudomonadota bacterium]